MRMIKLSDRDVLKFVERQLPVMRRRMAGVYGEDFFSLLSRETRKEIPAVAAALPALSGDSPFRFHLTAAGAMLAMARGMEAMGLSREEALRRMKEMGRRFYLGLPRIAKAYSRRRLFSLPFQSRLVAYSGRSERRDPAPGDWLFTIQPSDGRETPLRMDFSRCGIKLFCESLGRPDVCELLCSLDYAMAEAFGYHLERSGTLGEGREKCDFSYTRIGARP